MDFIVIIRKSITDNKSATDWYIFLHVYELFTRKMHMYVIKLQNILKYIRRITDLGLREGSPFPATSAEIRSYHMYIYLNFNYQLHLTYCPQLAGHA